MKYTFYLIVIISTITNTIGFSQKTFSRFSINPHIGIGVALPGKNEVQSGSETLTYNWEIFKVGNYINDDNTEVAQFKSTNRMGLNLGYDLTKNIEFRIGANRNTVIHSFTPSLQYEFNGNLFAKLVSDITFYDYSAGIKLKGGKYFFLVEGNFTPNAFGVAERKNQAYIDADFRNEDRTGIVYSQNTQNRQLLNAHAAIGKSIYFLYAPFEVQLGLNFGLNQITEYDIDFYERNRKIGTNTIALNNTVFYFTINKPIRFAKNKKEPKPVVVKEPKPKKEPKVETPAKVKKPQEVKLGNKTIKTGEEIVLNEIVFEQTKSVLQPKGMAELDIVYMLLKDNPNSKIELTGHTSNEGNRSDNIELSKKRAEACKEYLINKGIASKRIRAYGLGPDKPISTTEKDKNRRVEVKVISID